MSLDLGEIPMYDMMWLFKIICEC